MGKSSLNLPDSRTGMKSTTRKGFSISLFVITILGFVSEAFSGQIISTSSHSEEISATPTLTWAVIGSKVALPCDVTIPSSEDSISLILWYKNDRKSAPIYSIDARNTPIELAKHFISDSLRDRAKFELSTRPQALLHIDPVIGDDAGIYFCRVDFKWARTINTLSNLSVIVAPQVNVAIGRSRSPVDGLSSQRNGTMAHNNHDRSQPGRQSSREEDDDEDNELMMTRRRGGMIHEGTEAVIKCQIRANPPATSIHWFFNQRPISSDFPLPIPGITFSNNSTNLTIRSVSRRHEGMYKCSAVNIGGTGESPDFKVTVLFAPQIDLKIMKKSSSLPGSSSPSFNIHGTKSQLPTLFHPHHSVDDDDDDDSEERGEDKIIMSPSSNPSFSPPSSSSPVFPSSSPGSSRSISSSSNGSPRKRIKNEVNSVIRTGDEVVIECRIKSNPSVSSIYWYFNQQILSSDPIKGIIVSNSTLIVKGGNSKIGGRYKCSATNSEGTGESNNINLTVLYAPQIELGFRERAGKSSSSDQFDNGQSTSGSSNDGSGIKVGENGRRMTEDSNTKVVREGDEVMLDCRINSNPPVSQIDWILNNNVENPLLTDPMKGIIISNSTLIIKYVRRMHKGHFKCIASNTEGRGQSNQVALSVLHAPVCDIIVKDVTTLESQLALSSSSPSSSLSSSSSFDPSKMMMMAALISPQIENAPASFNPSLSSSSSSYLVQPSSSKSAFSFSPISSFSPSSSASSSESERVTGGGGGPSGVKSSSQERIPSSSRVISALPGKIATIECRVSANPSDGVSFYWTFNGSKIHSYSSSNSPISSSSFSLPSSSASSSKSKSSVNSASSSSSFSAPVSGHNAGSSLYSPSSSSSSFSPSSSLSSYNIVNSTSSSLLNPFMKQIKLPIGSGGREEGGGRKEEESSQFLSQLSSVQRDEIERGLKEANFVEINDGGLRSILHFRPINPSTDFGMIACWASNQIGSQMSPCLFTLIPETPGPTANDEAVSKVSNNKKDTSSKNSRSESNEKLVNSNELNATIAVIIGIGSTLTVILVIILLLVMIRSRDERAAASNRGNGMTSGGSGQGGEQSGETSMDHLPFNGQSEDQQPLNPSSRQWMNQPVNHCQMMANGLVDNLWTADGNGGYGVQLDNRWIPDVCPNMDNVGQWIPHGYPMTTCDPLMVLPTDGSSGSGASDLKVMDQSSQLDPCQCHVTVLPITGSPNLQMYKVTTI